MTRVDEIKLSVLLNAINSLILIEEAEKELSKEGSVCHDCDSLEDCTNIITNMKAGNMTIIETSLKEGAKEKFESGEVSLQELKEDLEMHRQISPDTIQEMEEALKLLGIEL